MKAIIMIDLDGVVLNKNYETTKDITGVIRRLMGNGDFLLVPNSDTPRKRLKNLFSASLGFCPKTIIAKNGAVVSLESRNILPFNIGGINSFKLELIKLFRSSGYRVKVGDSTIWIRKRKKFEPNTRLIILDGFREQSIGFFIKETNENGHPKTNQSLSDEALSLLSNEIEVPEGLAPISYNSDYGIAISSARGATKTTGYRVLRGIYPNHVFYMIGDSDADIIQDKSVTMCAVGNGSPSLKKITRFSAKDGLTAGLEECLEWIEHDASR